MTIRVANLLRLNRTSGIVLCRCGAGGVIEPETQRVDWLTPHDPACPGAGQHLRIPKEGVLHD